MGASGMVVAHLICRLSIAIEVEVHTNGTHTRQRSKSLLLIVAIARGPMAVRTDEEGFLTLLQRGIDGTKDMLAGSQLKAYVLRGVAVMLLYLREDGRCILYAGIEEGINLQELAHFLLQDGTALFPLLHITILCRQPFEHLPAFILVTARIFVELYFIAVATLFPPIPVIMLADVI